METPRETDWRLVEGDGLVAATCALLERVAGVGHAFSTRIDRRGDGERLDFDLASGAGPSAENEARRRRLTRLAGLGGELPVAIRQVHGDRTLRIPADLERGGEDPPEADGVLVLRAEAPRAVAAVRMADCVPVLLADGRGRAVAAVHAGWRGTAAGVVGKAVERLDALGSPPGQLVAAVGPAIGPCCYEVGSEVARAVGRAVPADAAPGGTGPRGLWVDLPGAVSAQLRAAGLDPSSISRAPWCTACREDLFFSHRRDAERAGRMMAVIGWIPAAP